MQRFSQSPQTSTPTTLSNVPREQHAALFALINKARMLNGWSTRTAQELDPTIRTWSEIFEKYNIPISAYQELYQRSFELRQRRLGEGKDVPQMDATLLVSQWDSEWGLRKELYNRKVNEGRTLTVNAQTACQYCDGTGWKQVDPTDRLSPVMRCTHGN